MKGGIQLNSRAAALRGLVADPGQQRSADSSPLILHIDDQLIDVRKVPGTLSQGFAENQFGKPSSDYWLCRYTGGAAGDRLRCYQDE